MVFDRMPIQASRMVTFSSNKLRYTFWTISNAYLHAPLGFIPSEDDAGRWTQVV